MQLTSEQLHAFPTFLLQFVGSDENESIESPTSNIPLAKDLDPDHPNDILVAVPPSHYMEYQEEDGGYVAGFYWDEPEGIVIGANVMMKHNILFDVDNRRIGWAESSCNYTAIAAKELEEDTTAYLSPSDRYSRDEPSNDKFLGIIPLDSYWPIVAISFIFLIILGCRVFVVRRKRTTTKQPDRSYLLKSSSYAFRSPPLRRGSRRVARRTVSEMGALAGLRQTSSAVLDTVTEKSADSTTSVPPTSPKSVSRTRSKRGGILRSRSHQRDSEVFEMMALVEEAGP